ncbi:hypothetical protein N657DRAFT_156367 [Parathielavia appendiculata]|uniref:Uncharacterized protein n=1 Tax=Parathielavia appendiculata TaxID=2587402 RepID=A0AAN6Z0J3_9PEZI|nr:hypothetical protein N657DRAFT_156367 [Parathielavia appendiculata]
MMARVDGWLTVVGRPDSTSATSQLSLCFPFLFGTVEAIERGTALTMVQAGACRASSSGHGLFFLASLSKGTPVWWEIGRSHGHSAISSLQRLAAGSELHSAVLSTILLATKHHQGNRFRRLISPHPSSSGSRT